MFTHGRKNPWATFYKSNEGGLRLLFEAFDLFDHGVAAKEKALLVFL